MIGSGFANLFKIPELKQRILFTLGLLIVYRVGVQFPVPGVDSGALASIFATAKGSLLGLVDMFSGGALERLSVFALGIMPYISSSIILQLLTVMVPHLEQLKKEGEQGRKKITQYTRYGTAQNSRQLAHQSPEPEELSRSMCGSHRSHHRTGCSSGPPQGKSRQAREAPEGPGRSLEVLAAGNSQHCRHRPRYLADDQ